jgi:hypothetical protein
MLRVTTIQDLKSLPKPYQLQGADLSQAELARCDLRDANFQGANLREAFLTGADFRGARLAGANLGRIHAPGANFQGVDFTDTNLVGAYFDRTTNTQGATPVKSLVDLPPVGESFVAWKSVRGFDAKDFHKRFVLKLLVPPEALRVSTGFSQKCRVSTVEVLAAFSQSGTPYTGSPGFRSYYHFDFLYGIGQVVTVANFDPDLLRECTYGIHVFNTQEEAASW